MPYLDKRIMGSVVTWDKTRLGSHWKWQEKPRAACWRREVSAGLISFLLLGGGGVQFLEDFRAGQCGQRALKTVSTARLAEGETAVAWKADRKGEGRI